MGVRRGALVATAVVLIAATACSGLLPTTIGDIKARPRDYEGKTVTVKGQVKSSLSMFGIRYFTLDDGTGEITVVTERSVPREGDTVRARGKVDQAFAIGSASLVVIVEEAPGR